MSPVKRKQRFNGAGEDTKEKKKFVLSPPEADVFVINPFWLWLARTKFCHCDFLNKKNRGLKICPRFRTLWKLSFTSQRTSGRPVQ